MLQRKKRATSSPQEREEKKHTKDRVVCLGFGLFETMGRLRNFIRRWLRRTRTLIAALIAVAVGIPVTVLAGIFVGIPAFISLSFLLSSRVLLKCNRFFLFCSASIVDVASHRDTDSGLVWMVDNGYHCVHWSVLLFRIHCLPCVPLSRRAKGVCS